MREIIKKQEMMLELVLKEKKENRLHQLLISQQSNLNI
ncbi:unnamed protein product [Paramecium sonneborni]|uniref:Uncharacterized protein n=1 Tax=Paramecium sonneborni TaxID=65129 RepID=A0A8S1LYX6_9CILI|nr:unnamed protein product [Paramecium sonneborni]